MNVKKVTRLLGEGSYASVWECDVLAGDILGKRVAMKELKARDVNGANMDQMMLEVKALKSLQGDGVRGSSDFCCGVAPYD